MGNPAKKLAAYLGLLDQCSKRPNTASIASRHAVHLVHDETRFVRYSHSGRIGRLAHTLARYMTMLSLRTYLPATHPPIQRFVVHVHSTLHGNISEQHKIDAFAERYVLQRASCSWNH